jgi:zinc protease
MRAYPAPSYRTGAVDQAYPLQVMAELLGGGPTSRLYRSLVVERPLAVSAGADYEPSARGPSDLVVYASPRPGVSLEQLEEAVLKVIDDVVAAGLSDAEIDRAKRRLLADIVYARDSYSTTAYLIGEALAIGQTIDDIEAWPERIRAVDRAGVEAAARAVLAQPGVTSLLIAPDRSEGVALEGAKEEDPVDAGGAAPRPSAGAAIR